MRELDRLKCIQGLIDKQIKQKAVAERLGLTVRQVRRLVERYELEGPRRDSAEVVVLIDANETALEDAEETFKRIGVHIAMCPFVLGIIDRFVLRLIGHHGEVSFR